MRFSSPPRFIHCVSGLVVILLACLIHGLAQPALEYRPPDRQFLRRRDFLGAVINRDDLGGPGRDRLHE